MIIDNIWMIQIPDNEVSQKYARHTTDSWNIHGHTVKWFDAVTPDTLTRPFNSVSYHNHRQCTPTELAAWESHWALWNHCYESGEDITVIEHDTLCVTPRAKCKKLPYDIYSICDYYWDDWDRYGKRFDGHPYWGSKFKLVPITSGYCMTPKGAERVLEYHENRTLIKYSDDILLDRMNDDTRTDEHQRDYQWIGSVGFDNFVDRNKIVGYSRPIWKEELGGTVEHWID